VFTHKACVGLRTAPPVDSPTDPLGGGNHCQGVRINDRLSPLPHRCRKRISCR